VVKTPNGNLRLPKKTALVSRSAHDPRPADLADAPAALPPPLWPGLGKPFRLPQASLLRPVPRGYACNARPACAWFLPLSFIVISRIFTVVPAASRSSCPDIGVACHPVHRDSHLDPGAKKAGRTRSRLPQEKDKRKKIGDQPGPWPPPAGCAGQISPGEFFASALRTFGWLVASAHRPQAPAKRLKTAG